jgi:hypothetical protein
MFSGIKRYRGSFSALEIIDLFDQGLDTAEIANWLLVPEADIYNVLSMAKAVKKVFYDKNRIDVSALGEPPLENDQGR